MIYINKSETINEINPQTLLPYGYKIVNTNDGIKVLNPDETKASDYIDKNLKDNATKHI